MLAFTSRRGGCIVARRFASNAGQPASNSILWAADSESPSSRIVRGCAADAAGHGDTNTRHNRMDEQNLESMALVSAKGLGKYFEGPSGRLDILEDVDLEVNAGETVAITGASGSGKTTLLGLLAGLDVASHGSVRLDGHALESMDEEARARLRLKLVGFVFQSFHLLPALSAEENVLLPLELDGVAHASARAREALAAVGLAARGTHFPYQLSGGEQQRVAIARAFVHAPRVLFADEPTGNLDHHTRDAIADLLFRLNREHHTTLVLVTHDPAMAARCARVCDLVDGHLLAHAP
jgi:putative ABC transport system ATP-binding protein